MNPAAFDSAASESAGVAWTTRHTRSAVTAALSVLLGAFLALSAPHINGATFLAAFLFGVAVTQLVRLSEG